MSKTGSSTGNKETASKPAAAKESTAKESASKDAVAPKETSAKESTSKETAPKESAAKETTKTGIQNGKGDGPRNISPKFRKNYDQINWPKHRRVDGSHTRKVY